MALLVSEEPKAGQGQVQTGRDGVKYYSKAGPACRNLLSLTAGSGQWAIDARHDGVGVPCRDQSRCKTRWERDKNRVITVYWWGVCLATLLVPHHLSPGCMTGPQG